MSGPPSPGPSSNVRATRKAGSQSTATFGASLPYLALRTSGSETSWSPIARTGFPLLATSSYFVREVAQEVTELLKQFRNEWLEKVTQQDGLKSEPPLSPFEVFKRIYTQRGWHLFQLYWSEHYETRINIYHTIIRILVDHLRILLPLLGAAEGQKIKVDADQAFTLSSEDTLNACGVVFALRLLQSTTCFTLSDTDFEHHSGRIPIEADLYHVLLAIPSIVRASQKMIEWDNGHGFQPIDEVIYLIKEMTGEIASFYDAANGNIKSSSEIALDSDEDTTPSRPSSVFDVLAPTSYEARPAPIGNHISTIADVERRKRTWGELNREIHQEGAATSTTIGMSRADLMRNILRQKLQLPLKSHLESEGTQNENLSMKATRHGKRSKAIDGLFASLPQDEDAEQILQDSLEKVTKQQDRYESNKKQCTFGIHFASMQSAESSPSKMEGAPLAKGSDESSSIFAEAKREVFQTIRTSMIRQCRK